MSNTLLATKFYFPPARPDLVARPRLIDRLAGGLRGPLTLISAPAGYGKSTLLSEWRTSQEQNMPLAWLSLDERDNDLRLFLLYFLAALDILQPGFTQAAAALLQTPKNIDLDAFLTVLLNTLDGFERDFCLVLDDYHLIETPAIHQALNFLLNHLPLHMHLVLLTRADPPLLLSRLRARGQLTEIRAADLRFNADETTEFLNQVMGLNLSRDQASTLEQRTEGWIAGLQLAALSMQGREDAAAFIAAFTGSHQYIFDFLGEEVLNRQPETLREFLLVTSILERLTSPLCEALTGQPDGQALLEQLGQSNLFLIPLDDQRCWYRYHHLFADLLRNRLQRTRPPEELQRLHRCAADWFEQNQLLFDALNHSLVGGDTGRAAGLLKDHFSEIACSNRLPEFIQLVESIPEAQLCAHPRLCMFIAYIMAALGRNERVEHYIQSAEQSLEGLLHTGALINPSREYNAILAEIRSNQAGLAAVRGDYAQALSAAQAALALTDEADAFGRAFAYLNLALVYRYSGQFNEAIEACNQAQPLAKSARHVGLLADDYADAGKFYKLQGCLQRAWSLLQTAQQYGESQGYSQMAFWAPVYYGTADLLYEWNQIERANEILHNGIRVSQLGGRAIETIPGLIQLARNQIAVQDWKAAQDTLQQCSQAEGQSGVQHFHPQLAYHQARLQMHLGNPGPAAAWLSAQETTIPERFGFERGQLAMGRLHLLIALGRIDEALQALPQIITVAQAQGCLTWQIEALVLLALVWHKKGNLEHAFAALEKALCLAEPQGYQRIFLDEGKPLQQLLKACAARLADQRLASYSHRLMLAFVAELTPDQFDKQPLVVPLSQREVELLRLMAEGRSNQEIANQLVITVGTVKRHAIHIYTKLEVRNRTEAVAKARLLDLL